MSNKFSIKNTNEIFWASNEGFKRGRDPLGIENSSVATYGCLLPGITNQTHRVRYYSFYCWLLSQFYDIHLKSGSTLHQYNYIRRAELALAFMMHNLTLKGIIEATTAIPGSDFFPSRLIVDHCNLIEGADVDTPGRKYWTRPSGAFGQYYVGSLIALNLVNYSKAGFQLEEDGIKLAEAYQNSIDDKTLEHFLQCVLNGDICLADTKQLKQMAINSVRKDTEEWKSLNNLLISNSKNKKNLRQETIELFLPAINDRKTNVQNFPKYMYLQHSESDNTGAKFGWYFYYLCEAFHYSLETIFLHILHCAEQNNALLSESGFINLCHEQMMSGTLKNFDGETLEDSFCMNEISVPDQLTELKEKVKSKPFGEAAGMAFWLMARIWIETRPFAGNIIDFEQKNNLSHNNGTLSQALDCYIGKYLKNNISEIVKKAIVRIMNEHIITAYSKMGNTSANLCKFMLDDGKVIHIETIYPNTTNPRTQSLYDILSDMGYIKVR